MADCPEIYDGGSDLSGLLKSFSATYSMYGDYSASATLENPGCTLSINPLEASCIPIYGYLDFQATGLSSIIPPENLQECYNQSPKWIAGLMTSFGENQSGESSEVDISIGSYLVRLNSKPITSYRFSSNSLSALQQVLTYFGGVPATLYDLNVKANPIWGSFEGGSVMDAIKTLAQLSQSAAYIQVGGVLEVHRWKDHNSLVEITIPNQMIGVVTKRANDLIPKLAVQATGASFSIAGCGERVVSDARTSNDEGGISNNPGPARFTNLSGIDTEEVKGVIANLNAEREALQEVEFLNNPNVQIEKKEAADGNVKFVLKPLAGVIGPNGIDIDVSVLATWRKQNPDVNNRSLKALEREIARLNQNQLKTQQLLARSFSDEMDYFPASSKGGPASGPGSKLLANANIGANNQTTTQQSVFAFNTNVGFECGNAYEQIDNPLCNSKDVLFNIAVRRHQELLMDNNTFNINLNGFIPCLRLNQVIAFETPGTSTCPPRYVKGLITEIKVDYSADSQANMSLSVADLTVLGQTTYTSSNLLDWQCGGGANAIAENPWEASALALGTNATIQDSVVTLFGVPGTGLTYAYLNQFLTVGANYTLSFEYRRVFGTSPMFFNNTAGGGATILGPVGTYNENFTAALATPQFRWGVLSPFNRSMWRVFNIRLTRTVIA